MAKTKIAKRLIVHSSIEHVEWLIMVNKKVLAIFYIVIILINLRKNSKYKVPYL